MLHPQACVLLDLIARSGIPPTHTLAPVDARRFYRERRRITQPDAPELAEVRAASSGASGCVMRRRSR